MSYPQQPNPAPQPPYGQPVNPYPPYGQPQQPPPSRPRDRSILYILGGFGVLALVLVIVAMVGMSGTGDECLDAPRRSAAEQSAYAEQKRADCLAAARAEEQVAYQERVRKYGESAAMPPNPRAGEIACALGAIPNSFPESEASRQKECDAARAAERANDPVGTFADSNGAAFGAIGLLALAGGGFLLYRRQKNRGNGGNGGGYAPAATQYSAPMTLDDLTDVTPSVDTDGDPYNPNTY